MANKEKVNDTYLEHEAWHQEYHSDCSTCYSEASTLRVWKTVSTNKLREELGLDNDSALRSFNPNRYNPYE